MQLRKFYSTIVLSDIHLGTSYSKTVEVNNSMKSVNYKRLMQNGDIIDGWALKGLPYYSLSQTIKQKVKFAVSYVSDFEKELVKFAQARFDQVLIGEHISGISVAS